MFNKDSVGQPDPRMEGAGEEAGEAGHEVLVEGLQPAGSGEPGHPGKKGVRST